MSGVVQHFRPWIAAAALLAGGCASVEFGHDFDVRAFESKVQRGVTTQNQVRGWLGAPSGTGVSVDSAGEQFEEWTYYYGQGRLPNLADADFRIVQIKFDRNGIVRAYSWSRGP